MRQPIRIGTRDSELALWQARNVQDKLEALGHETELVPVKSEGDLVLDKPLYEFGITGIFTKTLDVAMLTGRIDIAVHSMKDVPTALPHGIVEGAVLKRANSKDLLLHKGLDFLKRHGTIATGSLRRKAQWLHKYPEHEVVAIRGNLQTRLKKLEESNWNGAIFAAAGLERIEIRPEEAITLDWMIPAPAQGAMLVVVKEDDYYCKEAVAALNHAATQRCTRVEREFLRTLEGGCTAPIGALATIDGEEVHFHGALFSVDGKQKLEISRKISIDAVEEFGVQCARDILANGGKELMKEVKARIGK